MNRSQTIILASAKAQTERERAEARLAEARRRARMIMPEVERGVERLRDAVASDRPDRSEAGSDLERALARMRSALARVDAALDAVWDLD